MQGLPRLLLGLFFRIRLAKKTQMKNAITATIMPTIAPIEKRCEELLSLVPVSEVRLGIVAKVENEGSNVM